MKQGDSLTALIKAVNSQIDENIVKTSGFLMNLSEEYYEIKKLRNQFDFQNDNKFNLFRELSNKDNLNERFYSKILAKILNPETSEIGDIEYLNIFMNLICKINVNISNHKFSRNVEVKTETDFIDILIKDDKYAIIIENKIANAKDQRDQLAKYYNKIKEKGLNPLAIVYIPLDPYKMPAFENYSKEFNNIVEDVKRIYVHLPAIYPDSLNKSDLAKGFLDQCALYSSNKKDMVANVFIEQFSKLVKEGGFEAMANLSRKRIIEKIFSDYNLVEIAYEIAEIWNEKERNVLLGEVFSEKLKNKIKKAMVKLDSETKVISLQEINNINVTIWSDEMAIGFESADGKSIPKDKKEKLIEILEDAEFSEYFDGIEIESKQIYRNFLYKKFKKSLDEAVDYFSMKFEKLIERVKKM
jgi:hypothetical protein